MATKAKLSSVDYTIPAINRRNLLINGGFDVWQRGTSQTTSGYGSVDRFSLFNTGTTKTASQQTFSLGQTDVPGNPKYFLRHVVSSVAGASNSCGFFQKIEGVQKAAGQTVTLSFYAKADSSKNIAIDLLQRFGTGGSPSADVTGIGAQKIALTSSWARYTTTITVPSITGKTLGTDNNDCLQLTFWFDAGSSFNSRTNTLGQQSGTFDIANVQLEIGTVATEFEQLPLEDTWALCQRYYQTTLFDGQYPGAVNPSGRLMTIATGTTSGQNAAITWHFQVRMRAIPTTQSYSPTTGTSGVFRDENSTADVGSSVSLVSQTAVRWIKTTAPTLNYIYSAQFIADAEL